MRRSPLLTARGSGRRRRACLGSARLGLSRGMEEEGKDRLEPTSAERINIERMKRLLPVCTRDWFFPTKTCQPT